LHRINKLVSNQQAYFNINELITEQTYLKNSRLISISASSLQSKFITKQAYDKISTQIFD